MVNHRGQRPWTNEEDSQIIGCEKYKGSRQLLAKSLGRTHNAVEHRIGALRAAGLLPPVVTSAQRSGQRHRGYANIGEPPTSIGPGITLNKDQDLVLACLAAGGFPRAVVLDGRTFWIRPDGAPWAHTPVAGRKLAA